MAAPCGSIFLSFFDNMPAKTLFVQPGETSRHVSGQLQISADGSRLMQSPYWSVGYRVLPYSADARAITGEAYWAAGANSPILDIEFQRDPDGRVIREILRSPPPPNSASPGNLRRVLGWYQYARNDVGQLRQLVYHFNAGPDGQWLTEDDGVLSRVEVDYGLGGDKPREATIFYALGERVPIRFDYDTAGRLIGGVRQGPWPTYFSVTSGLCEAVPERLFVLLLGPHGGPWHPFDSGRGGVRPTGPR
jgi:hypothetical protein